MPEDKVTFKSNGDYTIGAPLQEMDVHREKQEGDSPGAETPGGTGGATPATGKPGPKKFDMRKLRANARSKKPEEKKSEPAPATEGEPAAAVPKKPARKPPARKAAEKEAPVPKEELAPTEGATKDIRPEDMVPPPKHVMGGDPPIPAPTPEETREFKLQQLGVTNKEPPAEAAAPEPVEPPSQKESVQKLNLGTLSGGVKKAAPVSKEEDPGSGSVPPVSEPATDVVVSEPDPVVSPDASETAKVKNLDLGKVGEDAPKTVQEEVQETAENAPEFIFHTLDEYLQVTALEQSDLSAFAKAVAKAALRGGSIWRSKKFELLRAYSCAVASGRGVPRGARYLMTFGWDVHVTSCYVDQSYLVTDGSANLKCEGICAFVQGTPVALSLERKRDAVAV